jgi:cell division protein YceG involved in septum cleavage
MVHKAGPERKLSMKSRLIIIAIMFVIINLIFYFGFDSSNESEKSVELDDTNQVNVETGMDSEAEMIISVSP